MKLFSTICLSLLVMCSSLQTAECAILTTNVFVSLRMPANAARIRETRTPPRRHLSFPPPKLIAYPGMSDAYNNARFQSALKEDAALLMWDRGIKPEEFGLSDGRGGYAEPFRDHQLVEEALQIMLQYWQGQSFAELSAEEMSQFQTDLEHLAATDVANLAGKEWRRRGYKGDIFDIELEPLLAQSLVLPAIEIIAGPQLRDQVRTQMIAEFAARRHQP